MKKVVVVGLGKSGMSSARLLKELGDDVFITDLRDDSETRDASGFLIKEGIVQRQNVELGRHTEKLIKGACLVVVSPGVASGSLAVRLAEDKKIPVISELELAYSMCPAPIIAVTGTSGKTTVTTLIGNMLLSGGLDTVVCGNIGNPLSGEIKRIKPSSLVVLEVSSFQLEKIRTFKPKISIILNISDNHLDRHKDMDEYLFLKSKIFSNQNKDDVVFLNGKDKLLRGLSEAVRRRARIEFFDEYKDFRKRHNIENENYLAAMSVASMQGVDERIMLSEIANFKGIEHRLEYVATVKGVDFINDSKSTTVSSVEWALKSLDGRMILIMGGRFKGGDFGRLNALVREKVNCIVAIGEARSRIKKSFSKLKDVFEEDALDLAVRKAFKNARKGDKVLLSPGCSSLDMFKNYEERGRIFKDLCSRLSLGQF